MKIFFIVSCLSIGLCLDQNYPPGQGKGYLHKANKSCLTEGKRSEIKQIEGNHVARNGQIPGITDNPKLNRII